MVLASPCTCAVCTGLISVVFASVRVLSVGAIYSGPGIFAANVDYFSPRKHVFVAIGCRVYNKVNTVGNLL
jgi:hypothetical protein